MGVILNDFSMNLPYEYYPAIGEFMFRCSQLETQMHTILWAVVNINNKQGRVLTVGAAMKAIRAMLNTSVSEHMRGHLVPNTEKKLIQAVNSLVRRSKEFTDLRNKIAHGSWQYPIGGKLDEVRLLFVKDQHEKYLARFDKNLDAAYIHKQSVKLKSLNLAAKELLLNLYEFRGWNTSHLHGRKNVA